MSGLKLYQIVAYNEDDLADMSHSELVEELCDTTATFLTLDAAKRSVEDEAKGIYEDEEVECPVPVWTKGPDYWTWEDPNSGTTYTIHEIEALT